MQKREEVVAIVKCKSYNQKDVDVAVKKIIELLEFDAGKYKNVLIKPNVVGIFDKNEEAIIVHPNIITSLMKNFKNSKVGESSFTNTEIAFKELGYSKFNPIVFEENKIVKVNDKNAKVLKNFFLPESVKKADLVIDVSKLKTHTLTKMTGAVKNLYGCIPGGLKQTYHAYAQGDEKFSNLLVDIYQNIMPGLNIMDAVVSMEGEGPTSGDPVKTRLLIGSKNSIALDIVAAKIIGYNPEEILTIKEAEKRFGKINIKIVGEKLKNFHFKKPSSYNKKSAKKMLSQMAEQKVCCNIKKCIKCGKCMKHCPMKAINMNPYPEVDYKKCIRCFCCVEVCPTNAMHLGK
jgi:uncharacterized protein (DUF362 family)